MLDAESGIFRIPHDAVNLSLKQRANHTAVSFTGPAFGLGVVALLGDGGLGNARQRLAHVLDDRTIRDSVPLRYEGGVVVTQPDL